MPREWVFPARMDDSPYDGDTFKLELDLGFGLRHYASIRLYGVDTPEIRGGTELTKLAAKAARDEAERFIRQGGDVEFRCVVWGGKYGRPVGDILADGKSLAFHLISERLGVAYMGGSRRDIFAQHERNAAWLREQGRI